MLATCSADKTVKLWNARDYTLLKTLSVFVSSTVLPVSSYSHGHAGPHSLGVGRRILR